MKVYKKEIRFCPECSFFEYNNSFALPEGWLCIKANKIIAPLNKVVKFIPEWCPLPDQTVANEEMKK